MLVKLANARLASTAKVGAQLNDTNWGIVFFVLADPSFFFFLCALEVLLASGFVVLIVGTVVATHRARRPAHQVAYWWLVTSVGALSPLIALLVSQSLGKGPFATGAICDFLWPFIGLVFSLVALGIELRIRPGETREECKDVVGLNAGA